MALDPRIILGGQAPQIEGPLDTYGKALSLKSLMDQNAMNKLKMQEAERGIADEQDLRNLARQAGGDQNKLRELLNQSGRFKEARAIEESGLKLDETRADIAKKSADTANTTSQMSERDWKLKKDRFATIRSQGQGALAIYQQFIDKGMSDQQARAASQPYYDRAVQEIAQSGLFDETELSKMPKQFDPRLVMQGVQGTLEGDKYLDNLRGDKQLVETTRNNKAQNALTARGQDITVRGQDLADTRARDKNDIDAGKYVAENVSGIRKEFNALPEVKSYKQVLPIIQSIKRAPDTSAGDLDIIYGVGKIMDPESVVREGEMDLVIKSGSPAQRMQGYWNHVIGGGRLTPKMRQNLMEVLNSRTQGLEDSYNRSKKIYEQTADKQRLPKDQIFVDDTPVAEQPSSQQSTGTTRRYNPATGKIE